MGEAGSVGSVEEEGVRNGSEFCGLGKLRTCEFGFARFPG